jgi:hypothetical protein
MSCSNKHTQNGFPWQFGLPQKEEEKEEEEKEVPGTILVYDAVSSPALVPRAAVLTSPGLCVLSLFAPEHKSGH